MSLRRCWRPETAVFVSLFFVLMAIGPSSMLDDPGTFWHLAIGERTLREGAVGSVDTLSYTRAGHTWLSNAWLFDCIVAALQRLAGLDAVLMAAAASLAAFYAWLMRRLLAGGMQAPVALLVLVLGVAASSHHFLVRPHLATMFLLGWTCARLVDVEGGRRRLPSLFALLPAFALWANLHGGALAGVATVTIACGGWVGARALGLRSPVTGAGSTALVVLLPLLCAAALLVNPWGIALPLMWFDIVELPVLPRLIIEHAPTDFTSSAGASTLAIAVVYFACLAGTRPRSWTAARLLPVVWFALACSRVRHTPLFAIVATVAVAAMYRDVRWLAWLTRRGSELAAPSPPDEIAPRTAFVLPAVVVAATLALQVARVPLPVLGSGWARPDPAWWPVELLPELRALEARGRGEVRLFHEMLFGGFLAWATPGLPVFIDDRCELYGNERLAEYAAILGGDWSPFEGWDREYRFDHALVVPGSTFEAHLRASPSWQVVRETGAATMLRRVPGPTP